MKYYAEEGSDINLAVHGVVFARAIGSIGFNESEETTDGKVLASAKGYREDNIPEGKTLIEVTDEMIDLVLGKK